MATDRCLILPGDQPGTSSSRNETDDMALAGAAVDGRHRLLEIKAELKDIHERQQVLEKEAFDLRRRLWGESESTSLSLAKLDGSVAGMLVLERDATCKELRRMIKEKFGIQVRLCADTDALADTELIRDVFYPPEDKVTIVILPPEMPEMDCNTLLDALRAEAFDKERVELLRSVSLDGLFTVEQMVRIIGAMTHDNPYKVDVVMLLRDRLVDPPFTVEQMVRILGAMDHDNPGKMDVVMLLRDCLADRLFTVEQMVRIIGAMSHDPGKMDVVMLLRDRVVDPGNWQQIVDCLAHGSNKQILRTRLGVSFGL